MCVVKSFLHTQIKNIYNFIQVTDVLSTIVLNDDTVKNGKKIQMEHKLTRIPNNAVKELNLGLS